MILLKFLQFCEQFDQLLRLVVLHHFYSASRMHQHVLSHLRLYQPRVHVYQISVKIHFCSIFIKFNYPAGYRYSHIILLRFAVKPFFSDGP